MALDLAVFGVCVQTGALNTAALMRTHPPKGYPGNCLNYVTTNTSQCYLEGILKVRHQFVLAEQIADRLLGNACHNFNLQHRNSSVVFIDG